MQGYTQVTIVGNLVRDPEVRQTAGGNPVCNISLAVNTQNPKTKEEKVEFFDITLWEPTSDPVVQWKKKGDGLVVIGTLHQHKWEGPDGKERSKVGITGRKVIFMPRGGQGDNFQANQQRASAAKKPVEEPDFDELPF